MRNRIHCLGTIGLTQFLKASSTKQDINSIKDNGFMLFENARHPFLKETMTFCGQAELSRHMQVPVRAQA